MRLEPDRTALVVIDAQERLFPHIHAHAALETETVRLVRGMRTLELPILVTEQYPEKLGPTTRAIREALGPAYVPIEKAAFSCCGEAGFLEALEATKRSQVLIAGIESHVCIYQTAIDLVDRGYYVYLVTDAVSSRTPENRALGIDRMRAGGVLPTGVEMALFELVRVSGTDRFRAISKLLK